MFVLQGYFLISTKEAIQNLAVCEPASFEEAVMKEK